MSLVERDAVRAVILSPEREVLLLHVSSEKATRPFWITPGGGREPGESVEACLRRELREELSLESFAIGPLLWTREHAFDWGEDRYHQRERFHVIETAKFTPKVLDPIEAETIDAVRWWTLEELAETVERVTPPELHGLIAAWLRDRTSRPDT